MTGKLSPLVLDVISRADLDRATLPEEQAWTLPPAAYVSKDVYEAEVQEIFLKNWLPVGRVEQVAAPGDYFTFELLGRPLVMVRGRDGQIRCFSRVCLHRGAEVAEGSGSTRLFLCPYHHWSYDLEGRLVAAPLTEELTDLKGEDCRLPALRVELWNGFIFVNFDADAAGLSEAITGLSEFMGPYGLEDMRLAPEGLTFDSPYNWKILVENFMEAYHHIGPHAATLRDPYPVEQSYVPDNEGGAWSVLAMPGATESHGAFPPIATLTDWRRHGLVAVTAFPTMLLAASGDGALWYQITPIAWDRFTLDIRFLLPKDSFAEPEFEARFAGWQGVVDLVHREDHAINLNVWRGLQSKMAKAGRLTRFERAIWQMNAWWCAQMRPVASS